MTYRGIVKNDSVELLRGVQLSDGMPVRIEPEQADWRADWERFARQVDRE